MPDLVVFPDPDTVNRLVDLRRQGVSFRDCSKLLGFDSPGEAAECYRHQYLAEIPVMSADETRMIEVERIEQVQAALWPKVAEGVARSAEVWLKASERKADLLGLDAPARLSYVEIDETAVEVELERLRYEALRKGLNPDAILAAAQQPMAELGRGDVEDGDLEDDDEDFEEGVDDDDV